MIIDDWQAHLSTGEPLEKSSKCITKILVQDGLLSANYGVRNQFRDHLKFMAESVKSHTLTEQPFMFLLKVLLQINDVTANKAKESAQYYQLLHALIGQYLKSIRTGEATSLAG